MKKSIRERFLDLLHRVSEKHCAHDCHEQPDGAHCLFHELADPLEALLFDAWKQGIAAARAAGPGSEPCCCWLYPFGPQDAARETHSCPCPECLP